VYVYDFLSQQIHHIEGGGTMNAPLADDGFNYYIIAQPGISGIALFGDAGKFVSCGKQRIASLTENAQSLTAQLIFAAGENSIRLHGCCESAVKAKAVGQDLTVAYDAATQHFYVDIDAKLASSQHDGTRSLEVIFTKN
jgi:hypothetical protein